MPFVSTPGLAPTQHVRVGLAEFQRPLPDRLVRNENPAAGHQLFDVAKAQAETEIQPHHMADDLGRIAKTAVQVG